MKTVGDLDHLGTVSGPVTWFCWLSLVSLKATYPWRSPVQPGEAQFQSTMPDQEAQVHSLKWAESLVWAQADFFPETANKVLINQLYS